ncbi:hypothetical protein B0H19DRAFT_1214611 [Mycena capillaripes]|nr:hypothetical protein B0H19DRAFT_1214611 [Mycena capillaripes]
MKVQDVAVRPSTRIKLDAIREKISEAFDKYTSDEEIWISVHNRDILPRAAQFLWKGIHNAHKVGHYCSHIPECEDREMCGECEVEEGLEHILADCRSPGQEIIWQAAETTWAGKQREWPTVSLGGILGCGPADFRDEKGKRDQGAERLYRILMSEAAYLIWKIRNDRVINRDSEPVSESEIINKWKYNIEHRRQVDIVLANRPPKNPRVLVGSGVPKGPRMQNGVG